jgi:hypothetical protein
MTRAVHVIKDIMSDAVEKVPAAGIEAATREVHRRTEQFPANVIVFNVEMHNILADLGIDRLLPAGPDQLRVFESTIPDAHYFGILNHRYFAFVSEHVPSDHALVFNAGWEAEGHPPREGDKTVYCLIDHTPVVARQGRAVFLDTY